MTDARPDPLNGARWDVRHGDALDVLRGLPDGSISAVVTDPPYGLSSHDRHVPAILRAWLDGSDAADVAARLRGFMGREWDALPPSPVVWREVLRVLKPGGHCLAFGGTRTSHLVAIGLQLAGFEIRDAIEASGLASAPHPVVPLPQKKSATMPPGGVTSRQSQRMISTGFTVGWKLRTRSAVRPAPARGESMPALPASRSTASAPVRAGSRSHPRSRSARDAFGQYRNGHASASA